MNRLKVQRICQHCGIEFTAQKTVTKYCSLVCGRRANKLKARNAKIERSNAETQAIRTQSIEVLKTKEFLTAREAATLLNCSVRSLYYYVTAGNIKAANLGKRLTRIKRSDIDHLFQSSKPGMPNISKKENYNIDECYTLSEIRNRFNISDKALNELIKRNSIPKMKLGWHTHVPKILIDQIFILSATISNGK